MTVQHTDPATVEDRPEPMPEDELSKIREFVDRGVISGAMGWTMFGWVEGLLAEVDHYRSELEAAQAGLDKAREDLDVLEPIAAPHRMTADQRERYRRHASWQSADHYLKQAEAAARRWQKEADWLREFRDERKAETEAGTWPPSKDFDCCERHPARALGLGEEADEPARACDHRQCPPNECRGC